jgi:hypothetical protein
MMMTMAAAAEKIVVPGIRQIGNLFGLERGNNVKRQRRLMFLSCLGFLNFQLSLMKIAVAPKPETR